jgi:serine/threonine protein phosphatase 1
MRVLAIGDIHGCSVALDTLLSEVGPGAQDTVVTLGDYINRGPDTKGVLDRLIDLSRTVHVVPLRGNHEVVMSRARKSSHDWSFWQEIGGDATLASYGSFEAIPRTHWDFIENQCLRLWETDTHFFVHANAYPNVPLNEQPDLAIYWGRFDNTWPHNSGKVMVCGHTSQKDGLPRNRGYAICIDTWACGRGWLSCLDVEAGVIWQANQAGQSRRLALDDMREG